MNEILFPTPQRGFTMIELLISIVIGLFLLTGLSLIFISNKISFTTQNGLAQLQNNQLFAINMMTNVIQSAGYYPNPQTNSTSSNLPANAGVSVSITNGTSSSTLTVSYPPMGALSGGSINGSDSISVRSIGAMNCTGNTSSHLVSSTFSVDSHNNLQCTTWDITLCPNACSSNCCPPTQTLVTGVNGMTVLYGVSPASDSATQYMTAAQVTTNNMWGRIMSVRLTLNFVNPLYASNKGQSQYLQFIRVIGIMEHL